MRIKQGDTWHTTEGENGEPLLVELDPREVALLLHMIQNDPRGPFAGARRLALFPDDPAKWTIEARRRWAMDACDNDPAHFVAIDCSPEGVGEVVAGYQDSDGTVTHEARVPLEGTLDPEPTKH